MMNPLNRLTREEALARIEDADLTKLNAIHEILDERDYQDDIWGDIASRVEAGLDMTDWATIVAEEVGEFSEAALHDKFGGTEAPKVLYEAVQIAAVGLAILEFLAERERQSEAAVA
jgi:hypothetical protein